MSKQYFSINERSCPCCGANLAPDWYVLMMNKLRAFAGVPIYINSWSRCISHNREVDGVEGSSHIGGIATDIRINKIKGVPMSSEELYKLINSSIKAGFNRIVIYRTFIHIDCDIDKPINIIKVVSEK